MRSITSEANARKVLFGRSGSLANAAYIAGVSTETAAQVDGKYLVLGKGPADPKNRNPQPPTYANWATSSTTRLAANEVLLWADDVMTSPFTFAGGTSCAWGPCNTFDAGTANDGVASYESYVARVSRHLGSNTYYSDVELEQVGAASPLNAVCTNAVGCTGRYDAAGPNGQQTSVGLYRAFPLSTGDMAEYFNVSDGLVSDDRAKRRCSAGSCNNGALGSWLRSARWDITNIAFHVDSTGSVPRDYTYWADDGLRPALRLNFENLLLSAHSGDQSQVLNAPNSASPDSLRLTFVDAGTSVVLTGKPTIVQVSGGKWELKNLAGASDLTDAEGINVQSGLGWKLVDPTDDSGKVVASGRTNRDAAAKSDGNMVVPCETLTPDKAYILSVWGQEDGSDTVGWSNRATKPVTGTVTADGDGVCALDIRNPVSYGIELTGTTAGTLTAYRIGDYQDEVFDQTGALKSVRLDTSEGLGTVLKDAAEIAGGSNVDADNPIGWVAAKWLGYPTDPLSDDVTSAFSPYAGSLQLFAQQLAGKSDAELGGVKSMPLAGVSGSATLKVSGPGLYLIVDSTQSSGGSLPIIVGTKVFNEALGDEGRFVDFVDAGVKGKPRLGQAALKTTVTDIAKRIVNDAGMDGFDVGSEVEFEIALRVPDLSGFSSVSYDSYVFDVADVAASGLTLPADGSGVEVFVDALSPTQPQTLPPSSIVVSGDKLSVDGLKVLFAESDGISGVRNKNTVPAGSLMRLRYKAVLSASAVVSSPVEGESLKPNVNTATLTRSRIGEVSNGWTDAGAGLESKAATANAYTFKLDVVKLDKDDPSKRLGGVEFEVSRDGQPLKFVGSDGVYRLAVDGETGSATTVTTKADGTLSLLGVEARELSFKETTAPSGYFAVSDFGVDILPEWDADATLVTKVTYATSGTNLAYVSQDGKHVMVLDPAWSLANLPYTGGVGILVLLVVGGLMLAFAIRPYYLSKRAERDANLV